MSKTVNNLLHRRFSALLEEIMDSDDPPFGGDHYDLLEKRLFEIQQSVADFILDGSTGE